MGYFLRNILPIFVVFTVLIFCVGWMTTNDNQVFNGDLDVRGSVHLDGLQAQRSITLANNTQRLLPVADEQGFMIVGDGTNNAVMHIGSDASVTSIASSGTVATSDSGSTIAVYDSGTQVGVVNYTGSENTIKVLYAH